MNRTRRGERPWPHCCVELDRRDDPAAFIAEDSVLWAVVKGHRRRGFDKLLIPGAFGGLMDKVPPVTGALLSEQFGHADAGPADHILLGEVSIDPGKCKGCNLCVTACATAALELIDKKARMVLDMPACIACGDCVAICPEDAITIVKFLEFKMAFRYLDRGKPSWPRTF